MRRGGRRVVAGAAAALLLAAAFAAPMGCGKEEPAAGTSTGGKAMIVVSGDTGGWIVPCGCAAKQAGGLLRRGTYLEDQRKSGEVVYVDVGGAAAGTTEYFREKFRAVLAGERLMGIAAHNLGGPEIAMGVETLRKAAAEGTPFVSANTRATDGKPLGEPVKVVTGGGKRVALVGVVSPRFATAEVAVDEPLAAVVRAAESAKGKYDSLVVLAYLNDDELTKLAEALPEADAVIGGPTGQAIAPKKVGPTVVGSATNKGKFLVALEGEERGWQGKIVELGPEFTDQASQTENLKGYLQRVAERDFAASETGLVAVVKDAPADYRVAGSESCLKCHTQDHTHWGGTKHAHALDPLVARGGFEGDPTCLQCHTTSFGMPGGFQSPKRTPALMAVGCESCHGPSAAHAAKPTVKTPFIAMDQCVRCHDHENSPTFVRETYWAKIKHGVKVKMPEKLPEVGVK